MSKAGKPNATDRRYTPDLQGIQNRKADLLLKKKQIENYLQALEITETVLVNLYRKTASPLLKGIDWNG